MKPGVLTVYRWELRKLRSQKRTYLGLGAAALVPIIFVVALATQSGQPDDVAFGRYLHDTGLAIPLVLLLFGSVWMFPLITALVAGDIVAAEDHNGTLKTILTRSVERQQIFAGKALATVTYAIAAIALTGAVALVAGIARLRLQPARRRLSGTTVSAGRRRSGWSARSLLVYLIPILAIASIGLLFSTVFRNSAAAIVGTLMFSLLVQLIGILPGLGGLAPLPAEHPVQRLAGPPALADRLGADHPRRLGLRALRGARAARRLARLPAPRRRGRLSDARARPGRRRRRRRCGGCSSAASAPRASRSTRGGRRRRGAGAGRALGARPRRPRRRDAGPRRARGLPAAARQGADAASS